jgi:stage IV sporulation protein FB
MRQFSTWSLSLGRWFGVPVRLHAFFLLFAIFSMYLSTRNPDEGLARYGIACLIILFISVVLHEVGHCLAAIRVGGRIGEFIIGPLGGLDDHDVPHEPRAELATSLAGPLMNLIICLVCIPLLLNRDVEAVGILGLLNPLHPWQVTDGSLSTAVLKLTFWINWLLVLSNALPAFPMDGGRILRSLLWPRFGYRSAVIYVARVAKVLAALMVGFAILQHDAFPTGIVPAWVPMSFFAIFLFFSANQEVERLAQDDFDEDLFGYDFSQEIDEFDDHDFDTHEFEDEETASAQPTTGFLAQWVEKRRKERQRQHHALEEEDERRMDEILAQLHEHGIDSLPPADREILNRVSARYRTRRQSSTSPQ